MHWVEAACWGKTQNSQYSMRHSWLTKVIKAIWTFTDTMWTHRNSILHGKENQAKTIRESSVNQQIVNFNGAQADITSTDRVIFDLPLDARLSLSFWSKKHWLESIFFQHKRPLHRTATTSYIFLPHHKTFSDNPQQTIHMSSTTLINKTLKPIRKNQQSQPQIESIYPHIENMHKLLKKANPYQI